jgi:riboflavin kinase / FMN adenylyltransferase
MSGLRSAPLYCPPLMVTAHMELIRGLSGLRPRHLGSVVTIGTFDGIHPGHQALIDSLLKQGQRLGRPAMMLTFEPMPREYLAASNPPARLTSWRERWRALERTGLSSVLQLRFDERLRNVTGEAFTKLLAEELKVAAVVIGHDFKFGRNGEASVPILSEAGRRLGFDVEVVPPVLVEGVRVSSSEIRAALACGDLERAKRLLGRPYSMIGRVVLGQQLGRDLGFPTANLRLGRKRTPLQGIFAVRVHGIEGFPNAPGVASLGTRPTVGGVVPLLEAHVFDFSGDLYGREIEVEFVSKLREEECFASLDVMVEQMHRDAAQARDILRRN